jgi:hypothetical protein
MEDVWDLYAQVYDWYYPQVGFDERPCQLISEKQIPLRAKPGQPERVDYEYVREGTCNIFGFFQPLTGWREMKVTSQRTAIDFAHCMKQLVDEQFPEAIKVKVVLDNLNTHTPSSLYKAFPPQEAKRILDRLEFHYTPKHGSWLNMVEIEFSVLSGQCLNRRIPDLETMRQEVTAWTQERNQLLAIIDWRFTSSDARIKLKRLYPQTTCQN